MTSDDLENKKLVKAQRRSAEYGIWFELGKMIAMLFVSAFLFVAIQRPESALNHRKSNDEISRERAKLLLELLKEEDPTKMAIGVKIVAAAYPEPHEPWLDTMSALFTEYSSLLDTQVKLRADSTVNENGLQLDSVTTEIGEVRDRLRRVAISPSPVPTRTRTVPVQPPVPSMGWVYFGEMNPAGGWKTRYFRIEDGTTYPASGTTVYSITPVNVRERYIQYYGENPRTVATIPTGQQLRIREIKRIPNERGDSVFWWLYYER